MSQEHTSSGRSATIPLIIIALFTVLLVMVGVELYARHSVGTAIADSISQNINEECLAQQGDANADRPCSDYGVRVETSFGAMPILFSYPSKKLPQITVTIGPLPPKDLRAGTIVKFDAKNIDYRNQNNIFFGEADATLAIPPQTLQNLIDEELRNQGGVFLENFRVTKVTYQAEAGTVKIIFSNGAATLVIKPTVRDGKFAFELLRADVAGFSHPAITEGLKSLIPELSGTYLELLPPQFSAKSVEVKNREIHVHLHGSEFTSRQLEVLGETREAR